MSQPTTTALTNELAEYTVTISRVRSEYAYVAVKATDSDSAEAIVNDLLEDGEELSELRFTPGGDTEGEIVIGADPREPHDAIGCVVEDGVPKFPTPTETVRGFAETIAAMTLDGECPSCMQDGGLPNPECDDHRAFRMTAEDNKDTMTSLITKARSLIGQPTQTQPAPLLDHVHPIFANILHQHFPWLGTEPPVRAVARTHEPIAGEIIAILAHQQAARAWELVLALLGDDGGNPLALFAGVGSLEKLVGRDRAVEAVRLASDCTAWANEATKQAPANSVAFDATVAALTAATMKDAAKASAAHVRAVDAYRKALALSGALRRLEEMGLVTIGGGNHAQTV
jgi:hypothetical protein